MELDVNTLYNRRNDSRFNRVAVGDLVERITYSYPDKHAIIACEGAYSDPNYREVSYRQFNEVANQFANALLDRGFQRGDRVLFFCDNSAEAMIGKFGVAKAGLVNVPVNTMIAPDVIEYIIQLTEPVFIVSDAAHNEKLESILSRLNRTSDVTILIGGDELATGAESFTDFVNRSSTEAPDVTIHGDDIWEILFTSGTTSMPKGVMISHHYTYFAGYDYGMHFSRGLTFPGDYVLASFLPTIYHVADQTLPASVFLHAGTLVLGRSLDYPQLAQAITDYKVTALWAGFSDMLEKLVDCYDDHEQLYDFSSLTSILYGYAALKPAYHKRLKEIGAPHIQTFESFAQTEVIAGYRFYHDQHEVAYLEKAPLVNYVGFPDATLAAKRIDEQGQEVDAEEAGEVVYQSPISFSGYYKNAEATRASFTPDGWFKSGDGLAKDSDGVSIMIGRYKDIIKSGGENVASPRVESVIKLHDAVDNAAVIGLPSEKWGEEVTAVVVLKDGITVSEADLIAFCRKRLAGFETPKKVIFTDSLPESVAGKIRKYDLVQKYS
ncbi:AMP-binding protein [Dolosigranulum pigrum]